MYSVQHVEPDCFLDLGTGVKKQPLSASWCLEDRAFYHDPLLVSHAQHLQTVKALGLQSPSEKAFGIGFQGDRLQKEVVGDL